MTVSAPVRPPAISTGVYVIAGIPHSSEELVQYYSRLVRDYPLWSIEDGMAEDDREGWRLLHAETGRAHPDHG
jgi:enolase